MQAPIKGRFRWQVVTTLAVDCQRHWSRVFIDSANGSGNTFGVHTVWQSSALLTSQRTASLVQSCMYRAW